MWFCFLVVRHIADEEFFFNFSVGCVETVVVYVVEYVRVLCRKFISSKLIGLCGGTTIGVN